VYGKRKALSINVARPAEQKDQKDRSLVTLEGGLRWKADLLGMGGFLEL
jgi:hypothetical protein